MKDSKLVKTECLKEIDKEVIEYKVLSHNNDIQLSIHSMTGEMISSTIMAG